MSSNKRALCEVPNVPTGQKRCQLSINVAGVQESYEDDSICLDDLVLLNVASKMKYIDRLTQDGVSHSFASILQTTNKNAEVSLEITGEPVEDGCVPRFKVIFSTSLLSSDYVHSNLPNLKKILMHVFSRFHYFRKLKIIGYPSHQFMECLVSMFNENALLFPSELRILHISAKSMSDRVDVKGAVQLIDKLSPLFGELYCNLNSCSLSLLENYSKELWNSIGTCANLRKLTLLSMENCDQFCEVEMISSLNQLPLTKLRCNIPVDARWLSEALSANHSLLSLIFENEIDQHHHLLDVLSSPLVLPIIERLHTLGISYTHTRSYNVLRRPLVTDLQEKTKLLQILRPLQENGIVKVIRWTGCYSVLTGYVVAAIQFWLDMSSQLFRTIKLCIQFSQWSKESANYAISVLKNELPAFTMEQVGKRTILRNGSAKVILSIVDKARS